MEAAKRSEIARAEFQRNSIPGLDNRWSNALAAEGHNSPDEDVNAIRKVTVADVTVCESTPAEREHHHDNAAAEAHRQANRGQGFRRRGTGYRRTDQARSIASMGSGHACHIESFRQPLGSPAA